MSGFRPLDIFTALDLEMNQPSQSIIQIGAVIGSLSSGLILEKLSLIVNPNETLDPFIVNLTGITQEQVNSGLSLSEAYQKLRKAHLNYNSFINPICWGGGDQDLLKKQLIESGSFNLEEWCLGRRWLDAKTLFVSWRIANNQPIQGGLAKSMPKVGLRFKGRKHDAADDAENTFYMYRKMCEMLRSKPDQEQIEEQGP